MVGEVSLAVAAAAAVAVAVLVVVDRFVDRRTRLRRRVIVTTSDGRSFAGVLWCRGRRFMVLRDVRLVEQSGSPVPVDGEVLLERDRVSFVQVLG